ncbi:ABC transporter ATP-binding protein [Streptomyces tagetis]|uniref:ABC transporter ATP-binding protein n=1 Tax=Streptomyces tagetis TaxID=2820809 RepID=UPI001FF92379|nr:ABC transporter ATP-binding protein [Streptomyces sp. RG38]
MSERTGVAATDEPGGAAGRDERSGGVVTEERSGGAATDGRDGEYGADDAHELLPVASPRRTWALLRAELSGHRGITAAAAVVTLLAGVAGLVAPWVLGGLVDDVRAGAGTDRLPPVIVALGTAAVAAGVLTGVGAALVARVGETVLARVRDRVLDRALHLPSATLERAGTGDLLARTGDDVAVVTAAVSGVVPPLVNAVFTVVLTIGGLFALDWRLGLAGLAAAPVYVLALRWYLPRSGPLYAEQRVATGVRTQALVTSLRGASTLRAYRWEAEHVGRVDRRSAVARDVSLTVFRLFTRFSSRLNLAEFIGLTAVLVTGFALVRADTVTVGAVTAAALYFHRLFNPVGFLVTQFDDVQEAGASLARLAGVATMSPPQEPEAPETPADASLELRGVTHAYGDRTVVREVTLRVEPGERVALVGATGAGKTTLASVAAGVLRPTAGEVRLGGARLERIGEGRLGRHVALLSQELHVFHGSVLDNLRLARPTADDEQLLAALGAVGALEWVRALPDGARTRVGEGAHPLTAAQAGHLALARLALADPAVAVLDEATAEAGSAGARMLEEAAEAATRGRTTLLVAHRLTQAERADRILVLDQGAVVESGSHAELLAARGRYAELWWSWTGLRPAPEDQRQPVPDGGPRPAPAVVPRPGPEARLRPGPEARLRPGPEARPRPGPEGVPGPTPEGVPGPTPDDAPQPDPAVGAQPTPEGAPSRTPEAAPSPGPEGTPSPGPEDGPRPSVPAPR